MCINFYDVSWYGSVVSKDNGTKSFMFSSPSKSSFLLFSVFSCVCVRTPFKISWYILRGLPCHKFHCMYWKHWAVCAPVLPWNLGVWWRTCLFSLPAHHRAAPLCQLCKQRIWCCSEPRPCMSLWLHPPRKAETINSDDKSCEDYCTDLQGTSLGAQGVRVAMGQSLCF